MRVLIVVVAVMTFSVVAGAGEVHWDKQTLLDEFVSEGASVAELDGDGNVDLISGPYWWRGPDFKAPLEYREGKPFDPRGYSDHFFSFTTDIDRDVSTRPATSTYDAARRRRLDRRGPAKSPDGDGARWLGLRDLLRSRRRRAGRARGAVD